MTIHKQKRIFLYISVDEEMADLVEALNRKALITQFSCQGGSEGNYKFAQVIFPSFRDGAYFADALRVSNIPFCLSMREVEYGTGVSVEFSNADIDKALQAFQDYWLTTPISGYYRENPETVTKILALVRSEAKGWQLVESCLYYEAEGEEGGVIYV